jgi:ubiquinone/menaquinone biosynthesis C-methylase UbiE
METAVTAAQECHARDLVERARPIGPSDRILDLGCGTGIVACMLRERLGGAANIVGLDASPILIEKARSLTPEMDWREGDVMALPFGAESFDLVLCQDMLRFLPDPVGALREVRRVLSPGGRLLASTWRPHGTPLGQTLAEAGFIEIGIEEVCISELVANVAMAIAPRTKKKMEEP